MKRLRMVATAFVAGLAIASASMSAAAAPRDEPLGGMVARFGVAAAAVFDGFITDDTSRGPATLQRAPTVDFADLYRIMATEAAARDPWAMTMACLGLMAVIAYRRRML